MSILVLQLPPRRRLGARAGEGAAGSGAPGEFDFVLSLDGSSVSQAGSAAPVLLPHADRTVLVLADADVGWHRVEVPKAPQAKLRAALAGTMEEALLDDDDALHFALGPGAQAGQRGWVAVTHRGWLADVLAALEGAGREITQVVSASRPRDPASGHFFTAGPADAPCLVLERPDGVTCLSLDGALARSLLPPAGAPVRWTATPAAASAAEQFLGSPVNVVTEAERALAACRNPVNLRQFDLAPRHRGLRALRESWRQFRSPVWRPVRIGLVALVVAHLIGLNAYAWQQERLLASKRQAMNDVLRTTYPGVRSVLDPPLQMQRETDRARALAGRVGAADFEGLASAAAAAWPDGIGPVAALRFEQGRLILTAPGWGEPQVRQFSERLRGAGYGAEFADGRVTVTPAKER
jgi:general secretion pathway protein L